MNAIEGVIPRLSTATTPTPGGGVGAAGPAAAVGLQALKPAQAKTSAKPRNANFMASPPGERDPRRPCRRGGGLARSSRPHKSDSRDPPLFPVAS